jgi:putative ABC transport system permease protein
VGYRLRRWLRSRIGATLLLTALVALVSGAVLSFASGASRTATAPDRFAARFDEGFDVLVQQQSLAPMTDAVRHLPAVRVVDAATFLFAGLTRTDTGDGVDGIVFAGDPEAIARVTSGREPDPSNPHEFVATQNFLDGAGIGVGDTLTLVTLTQGQADTEGFTGAPEGPSLDAVAVGVVDNASALDDPTPVAIFPASLLDQGDIGVKTTLMAVDLEPGSTIDDLRAQLDTLPSGSQLSIAPFEIVSATIRTAVDAQSVGLWILAGVAAIAAIAVLGQLIGRQVRMTFDERRRLEALGTTSKELRAEAMGRAASSVILGALLGVAIAVAASTLFPVGFSRRIEPTPGVHFDALTMLGGALVLIVGVLAWIALALRAREADRRTRRSPVFIGYHWRSPTAATGARFALTEQPGDTASPRTTVAGLGLIVAAMVGAATFSASLNRLVTDPPRFGMNFDMMYDVGGEEIPEDVREVFESSPDVAALSYYASIQARHDDVTVPLEGMELVKGSLAPVLISGHLPVAPTDIALGRLTANELHASIGDTVSLTNGDNVVDFRVTGYVVITPVGGFDQVGVGAVVTMTGLRSLEPDAVANAAAVDIADGVSLRAFIDKHRDQLPVDQFQPQISLPPSILNVSRVRPIPVALTAALGALALVTVVNLLFSSIHRRRRQLAVLRAMGADTHWIAGASRWQGAVFTILPCAGGAAVGILLAQILFRSFADNIGAVSDASVPFVLVAALTALLVIAGIVTASLSAHRELSRNTAAALRSE